MLLANILTDVCLMADEAATLGRIPPGAFSKILLVTDTLRADRAPYDEIRAAEDLSVAFLRLEWAIRRADETAVANAREQLAAIRLRFMECFDEGDDVPGYSIQRAA